MILAAHLIVGGVVGETVQNPIQAFVLAFLLHFVLDSIPHFDVLDGGKFTRRQWIFSWTEFLLGLAFIFFVMKPSLNIESNFLWGMIGGITPDIMNNLPFIAKFFNKSKFGIKMSAFHWGIHKEQPSFIIGMVIQLIVMALFASAYFYLR